LRRVGEITPEVIQQADTTLPSSFLLSLLLLDYEKNIMDYKKIARVQQQQLKSIWLAMKKARDEKELDEENIPEKEEGEDYEAWRDNEEAAVSMYGA